MQTGTFGAWGLDWARSTPLIILTVVFHAYALGLLHKDISSRLWRLSRKENLRSLSFNPIYVIGATAFSLTFLHGLEALGWAVFYLLLGATPNYRSSVLYSMNAMTSYGHENLQLAPQWHLMGCLEALCGWILFGLTTAFLFTVVQKVWSHSFQTQFDQA